ncbi:MAG: DUF3574 domain-containing protein [Silvibacterium sp.]|nr:DUF3574 domain-containing protein [Silvibacterium sp.]
MPNRLPALACLLLLALPTAAHFTGHAHAAQRSTLEGDTAHPAHAHGWVDTRLYFGLGPVEPGSSKSGNQHTEARVTDPEWLAFLDKEVTPRFPAGLSVIDCYGQWQGKEMAAPVRLRTKILIIDYPDTPANRAKIDAIRVAWKKRTGDQSVMTVIQPAQVSF